MPNFHNDRIDHPTPLRATDLLSHLAASYLEPDDHKWMDSALGRQSSVAAILNNPYWASERNSGIKAFMSNVAFVPHDLNEIGLHALRVVLCRRIADSLRKPPPSGMSDHILNVSHLYERFIEDGIVVIPNIDQIASRKGGLTGKYGKMLDAFVASVSGYRELNVNQHLDTVGIKDYVHTKVTSKLALLLEKSRKLNLPSRCDQRHTLLSNPTHVKHDLQQYMHTDTYMPTFKMWTFKGTAMEHGPFMYVKGSHKITEGKVRWLVERTRRLQRASEFYANDGRVQQCSGPFNESTHAFYPALRFIGFDNENPDGSETRNLLEPYGLPMPTPVVTIGRVIVIADTNGFHFRHWAKPGTHRYSTTFGGGGYIPRINYFEIAHQYR